MLENEKMENVTNESVANELANVYYSLVKNAFEDEFIFEEPGDCCQVYWELLWNVIYDDIRDVLKFDPNEELVKRALLKYLTTSEYDVYACKLNGNEFSIAYNDDIGTYLKNHEDPQIFGVSLGGWWKK